MTKIITLSEAKRLYGALYSNDRELLDDLNAANTYGMDPSYWTKSGLTPQTPKNLMDGYTREFLREIGCQNCADLEQAQREY